MISPLVLKVNVPTLLTAPFHRDCFTVEAAPARPIEGALFGSQSCVESHCVNVVQTCQTQNRLFS
jgi:hypothetical protein